MICVTSKKSGFILIFLLSIIAMLVVLITKIANVSRVHTRYAATMADREQAKMLAFSGLQIAMTQLAITENEKEKTGAEKTKEGEKSKKTETSKGPWTLHEAKQFIKNIFPVLNNWQIFTLKKKKDGIDGVIKICIGSEEGKIDINQLFDFKTRKFVGEKKAPTGDFKKFFQQLFKEIQKVIGGKNLFKKFESYLSKKKEFEQFLKNRQNKLYDPTEFLNFKEFEIFQGRTFYEPPSLAMKNAKIGKAGKKGNIYWTDIFTIWSGSKKLNPWLLSNSIKTVFGLKSKEIGKAEVKKRKINELLKHFKLNLSWPSDWDKIFATLYGVKYNNVPKWVRPLIDTTFVPKVFSVLSYGTVGDVTQKLIVILERNKVKRDKKTVVEFEIKKFYWI